MLRLNYVGATFKEYNKTDLIKIVAQFLSKGSAVGWMNSRMEFGPRSLGSKYTCRSKIRKNAKPIKFKVKFESLLDHLLLVF